jgi:hypothetical protein
MAHRSEDLVSFLLVFQLLFLSRELVLSLVGVNDVFGSLEKLRLNSSHRVAGNVLVLGDYSPSLVSCGSHPLSGLFFNISVR